VRATTTTSTARRGNKSLIIIININNKSKSSHNALLFVITAQHSTPAPTCGLRLPALSYSALPRHRANRQYTRAKGNITTRSLAALTAGPPAEERPKRTVPPRPAVIRARQRPQSRHSSDPPRRSHRRTLGCRAGADKMESAAATWRRKRPSRTRPAWVCSSATGGPRRPGTWPVRQTAWAPWP